MRLSEAQDSVGRLQVAPGNNKQLLNSHLLLSCCCIMLSEAQASVGRLQSGGFLSWSSNSSSGFSNLLQNQCCGSVTFLCLWQMDPDPAPDPAPDPTTFFSDFKDAKKLLFSYFFSYNLPTGTLSSVLNI
jgi:hypothetical protein